MDSANSAFQIVHANHLQAMLPAKSRKINYNCASPIGPNETGVFLRRERLSTVFVCPAAMGCDAAMRDCDHMGFVQFLPTAKCGEIRNFANGLSCRINESVIRFHVVAYAHAISVCPAFRGFQFAAALEQSDH
jgi:hypothetical protein